MLSRKRGGPKVAEVNDLNRNDQRLLAKTHFKGTDHNAHVWAVQCERNECGHVYGANSTDFHERKCPSCQAGKPGL
jgi:hypothetical protein